MHPCRCYSITLLSVPEMSLDIYEHLFDNISHYIHRRHGHGHGKHGKVIHSHRP